MYLLVDFLVSKAMRAILWDLGRNAPEKFLSTLIVCDPVNIMTQGKIDLRNESGRPMKVKVVGEVSEKWN